MTNKLRTSQKIYLPIKRLIGIVGSIVGIIFCFVLLWWWIIPINIIVTKGHPFFISKRIGQNGKTFSLIKFRSMKLDANPNMQSGDDAQTQVTGFGHFLRVTSFDETPQLINILFGQMAFIGPRPLIYTGDDIVTINEREKNGVICLKPGLSGYAQIHKRANLDPIKKAEYDYAYFCKMSFLFDVCVFIRTILVVFGAGKGR